MAHATLLLEHDIVSPVKRSRLSLKWNHQLELDSPLPLKPRSLFSSEYFESQQQNSSHSNNNKENLPFDNCTSQDKDAQFNDYFSQSAQSSLGISESIAPSQEVSAVGLPNCGNTCFVNSILQVLRYTPNFINCLCKILTSHKQLIQICNSDKLKEADFLLRMNRLFAAMKKVELPILRSKSEIGPLLRCLHSFLKCLREVSPIFEEGEQHDAHELLLSIISTFDSVKQNNQNEVEAHFSSESPTANIFANMSQTKSSGRPRRRKICEILEYPNVDLKLGFEGKICHAIKCLECESISKKFEIFSNLEVSLADHLFNEDTVDLRECLIQFETLSGENKYFCANCHHLNEADLYSKVVSLPSILLIHMSWLKQSSNMTSGEKDCIRVLIPLSLNSAENDRIFESSEEVIYSLYAVVLHLGNSSDGGHYISFIKEAFVSENQNCQFEYSTEAMNRWLLFNDESVTAISVQLADTFPYYEYLGTWASPCMIFYQRTN